MKPSGPLSAAKLAALCTLLLAVLLLSTSGCGGKKRYPDPTPGWHSADYGIIFGRLQRIPGKEPNDPPFWVVVYGFIKSDGYTGKLNLTPPEKMVGYRGGELVEIRGHINTSYQHPDLSGTWYDVNAIRLWNGQIPR